ncbi:Hydrolase [Lachnellula willkommii]|uniref:Hydrolase n=1 Tax=Lachnellula willkommii TaxID=215461 RepID=A0A559MJ48_9HELO|nr:Hydrolase [Lachnellula willkommii]
MSDAAAVHPCCLRGFEWEGTPIGRIDKLAGNDTYIAGGNPDIAILLIHDLLGWKFTNTRLLADHYAREVGATVYVPDFFGGEALPFEPITSGRWHEVDVPSFMKKNTREIREPEIFTCALALRNTYKRLGAVGFCYGGWAVFRLGTQEHQPPLVDCISAGHPTFLTKQDIDEVAVPVQILAPEIDPAFTQELKSYAFERIQKLGVGVPFVYRHFPGVEHACFIRGDEGREGEKEALVRGKGAVVGWMREFLCGA